MVLRSQQIFDGILPERIDSTDSKMAKNLPKPTRVQTLASTIGARIPLADTPRFSEPDETSTTSDQDSDPEVEWARQAFLEAQRKKKRRTVDNVHPGSTHKAPDEVLERVCSLFSICNQHTQIASLFQVFGQAPIF